MRKTNPLKNNKRNRYYINLNVKKSRFGVKGFLKILFHGSVICIFLTGISFLGVMLYEYVTTNESFNVKHIRIENNITVTKEEIKDTIGLKLGRNIFNLNLKICAAQLAKFPNIKYVKITKCLPDSILIRVYERTPVFQIKKSCYFYVDEDGVVLAKMSRHQDRTLPIVNGLDISVIGFGDKLDGQKIAVALKTIKSFSNSSARKRLNLKSIDVSHPDNVVLKTYLGNTIVLGNSDFDYRLEKLCKIYDHIKSKKILIASIDLRFENVPLTFRN